MTDDVPGGVVKVIELVGSSTSSFSDAVRNAVKVAGQSRATSGASMSCPRAPT